ncbi:class I SAM-dependent methyltransferase [Methylomonas sp. LL1]|uniref:class I SAM-dependent methyltransferase n=1 Tax=Methylomonas sp. LL1 TaxID=2785785 RepID=UPI0018C3BC51|nr:class I SAM-dependent methyltransferase [Methylomonas sp. LL1]QPK62544.1 class I SAM-dependent methyltransferase [Methylomonas sp. LL1]
MDQQTIETYDKEAASIAQLHSTLVPERIYELAKQFFIQDGKTLDVGCGIGRDTNWLCQQGYQAIGTDASDSMLTYARSLYPEVDFILDYLPNLETQGEAAFDNILCSAVLMHLNDADFMASCARLFSLLAENGVLIASFRGTNQQDNREKGKLYNPIAVDDFLEFFTNRKCAVLINESVADNSRGLVWNNFVIKK